MKLNLKRNLISETPGLRVSSTQNRREQKKLFTNKSSAFTDIVQETEPSLHNQSAFVPKSAINNGGPVSKAMIMNKIFSQNYDNKDNPKIYLKQIIKNYKKSKSTMSDVKTVNDVNNPEYSKDEIVARNYKPLSKPLKAVKYNSKKKTSLFSMVRFQI